MLGARVRLAGANAGKTTLFAGAPNGGTEVICKKRRRRFLPMKDGGSSSGRTTDSDSVYLGSNPSPPAKMHRPRNCGAFAFWRRRLGSRAEGPEARLWRAEQS